MGRLFLLILTSLLISSQNIAGAINFTATFNEEDFSAHS